MTVTKEKLVHILRDDPQFQRERHGSLFDRGSADSYYHRGPTPHWWPEGTGCGMIETDLTAAEIEEYYAGYEDNEQFGEKKDWG